ncbi:MAG: mechanosensitive ion channel family protein [Flavobacteriaceae bacterium]|nr:mechanosensitive ion channel family protein [Flavobacteriaceae bacterium]
MKKLLIFFILISNFAYAQHDVKVDLRNPNATLYTHIYFLMPDSYNVSKSSTSIRGLSKKEANQKAIKIKQVLDGMGLVINFKNVPINTNYLDTVLVSSQSIEKSLHRYAPFPIRLPDVYVEKIGTRWYYSKRTIEQIDAIHNSLFPSQLAWVAQKLPGFFKATVLGVLIWQPIIFILLIFVSVLSFYILRPIVLFLLKKIVKLFERKRSYQSFEILQELTRPIVFIFLIRFIQKIFPSLQLVNLNSFVIIGLKVAETVFWVMIVLTLIKLIVSLYNDINKDSRTRLDRQLAPIVNKFINGIVVLIGFFYIITIFGVNPTTVLAGASIGGIALAFAAQDSVKNLIGTVNIFLDKPFHIGDWVVIGGVEGTVEYVGIRSTRVRAADTSIFQIPNSKVSEMEINNKGLRLYRRYQTDLGIRYDTPPELIEAFVQGIREIIIEHPDTRSESYNVEFTGFGDSALEIMVNVFFKKLDWGDEQSSRHRLHISIVKLAAALGVEFAFPSSTLMIEQLPGQESLAAKYNTNKEDINKSIKSVIDEFKEIDHKPDPNTSSIPD